MTWFQDLWDDTQQVSAAGINDIDVLSKNVLVIIISQTQINGIPSLPDLH
jgi:hypothetical protein